MSSTLSRKVEDDLIDSALIATLLQLLEESQEVPNQPNQRQSRKINREEGQRRLQELLDCGHNDRIKAAFRMSRDTFYGLRNWLVKNTDLKDSTHISVEMKIAIFIHITTRPASQRDTIEHYCVGNRVISQ